MSVRTDLAMEEQELIRQANTELSGVVVREKEDGEIHITTVKILDETGAKLLHKPIGTYQTLQFAQRKGHEKSDFSKSVQTLASEIRQMVGEREKILVVGLGNDDITPDSVGPLALKSLIVTQHLHGLLPGFACVSAAQPGVLGTTGIESVQIVRAISEHVQPELIIVIDALASNTASHLCTTVQLTDTGIVPGSGVGNSRAAFNEETLGVRVVAIGVPTVMDGSIFAENAGENEEKCLYSDMVLTPKDIDAKVREVGKMVGYAIDLALHKGITVEDVAYFLA
ncbi:MAG: GPR endopeptidase [Oscillospiraceae bacterium]|nr:GPR endopeptidase [Oscillospiraceae bacterium]